MNALSALVSVVMPVHNCERTIGGSIQSVFAGTHKDVQLVVCDDASTDRTVEVVSALSDPRITLIRNDRNLGPGPSRDRAIERCRGRWLTFLDADDLWTPTRVSDLLTAAAGREDQLVFDDLLLCHQTAEGLKRWRRVHGPKAFGANGRSSVQVSPEAWASSRQFVMQPLVATASLHASGIRHSGRRFQEDTEFFLRLVAYGMKLRYLPRANYLYRITPGSLSSADDPGLRTRQVLEELLPAFAHNPAMQRALQHKIEYRKFTSAVKAGRVGEAIRRATRHPSFLKQLASRGLLAALYQASRLANGADAR